MTSSNVTTIAARATPTPLVVKDGQIRQTLMAAYKRRVTRFKGINAQPWMAEIRNKKPTVIVVVSMAITPGFPISSKDGAKIIRNGSM